MAEVCKADGDVLAVLPGAVDFAQVSVDEVQ